MSSTKRMRTLGRGGGSVEDLSATEIPFSVTYDRSLIDERFTYTVSARITDADGNLLFINDTSIPVITGGAPTSDVEVPVIEIQAPNDVGGSPRVIELELDNALRILQDGEQVQEIPVTPGERILFRVRNTAGFSHNFYIGRKALLKQPNGTTRVGIPDWDRGLRELEWTVPANADKLMFGCTIPGHFFLEQGRFTTN